MISERFSSQFQIKVFFFSSFTVSPYDLSLGSDDEPTFFLMDIVFHCPNVVSSHTSFTSDDIKSSLKAVVI